MTTDDDDDVRLGVADAAALGERALQRIGYSSDEARVITAHLVDSELCGYGAIGLTRSILAFGGHKGSGLALMVQALGLLAGAERPHGKVQDFAFLFIVFAPDLLMPAARFKQQLTELLARVRSTPTQAGVDAVRIPSERAFEERERRRREGIVLPRAIYDRLNAL
jgi:LDH2 family malate/lactate/ureidoglycolate dehydrogenase